MGGQVTHRMILVGRDIEQDAVGPCAVASSDPLTARYVCMLVTPLRCDL